jgi:hypothetical protein
MKTVRVPFNMFLLLLGNIKNNRIERIFDTKCQYIESFWTLTIVVLPRDPTSSVFGILLLDYLSVVWESYKMNFMNKVKIHCFDFFANAFLQFE